MSGQSVTLKHVGINADAETFAFSVEGRDKQVTVTDKRGSVEITDASGNPIKTSTQSFTRSFEAGISPELKEQFGAAIRQFRSTVHQDLAALKARIQSEGVDKTSLPFGNSCKAAGGTVEGKIFQNKEGNDFFIIADHNADGLTDGVSYERDGVKVEIHAPGTKTPTAKMGAFWHRAWNDSHYGVPPPETCQGIDAAHQGVAQYLSPFDVVLEFTK